MGIQQIPKFGPEGRTSAQNSTMMPCYHQSLKTLIPDAVLLGYCGKCMEEMNHLSLTLLKCLAKKYYNAENKEHKIDPLICSPIHLAYSHQGTM